MKNLKDLLGWGKTEAKKESEISNNDVAVEHASDEILNQLFVDNEPPQPEKLQSKIQPSKISEFLERNFESKGLNDGYEYGTQELLENSIKRYKSEFLTILDQMIEEKRLVLINLENQIHAVTNIAPVVVEQLKNSIAETKNSITELQKQKELTVENEGWVMNGIHSYRDGFIKGVITKQGENQLLNYTSNFLTSKN